MAKTVLRYGPDSAHAGIGLLLVAFVLVAWGLACLFRGKGMFRERAVSTVEHWRNVIALLSVGIWLSMLAVDHIMRSSCLIHVFALPPVIGCAAVAAVNLVTGEVHDHKAGRSFRRAKRPFLYYADIAIPLGIGLFFLGLWFQRVAL